MATRLTRLSRTCRPAKRSPSSAPGVSSGSALAKTPLNSPRRWGPSRSICLGLTRRLLRGLHSLAQRRQDVSQLVGDGCHALTFFEPFGAALIRRFRERFEAFRDARSTAKNDRRGDWRQQKDCGPDAHFTIVLVLLKDGRWLQEVIIGHGCLPPVLANMIRPARSATSDSVFVAACHFERVLCSVQY